MVKRTRNQGTTTQRDDNRSDHESADTEPRQAVYLDASASTDRPDNGHSIPPAGTASTQTPEEFYAELTQREDVQQILRKLARQ